MEKELVNKVEKSGIITVDILDFEPHEKPIFIDIKDFMFMEMIIKEKEFKETLENYSWESLIGKPVAIGCSVDTIVPTWTYMLLTKYLQGIAAVVDYCDIDSLHQKQWKDRIMTADFSHLDNEKVVVRARGDIHPSLYITITEKLKPTVGTLLYGEAGMPKVIHKNK